MLNTFRSFLINKIINRIRYLRYTTNYISINENNLNKIKHISRTLNKKELIARTEKNKIAHSSEKPKKIEPTCST